VAVLLLNSVSSLGLMRAPPGGRGLLMLLVTATAPVLGVVDAPVVLAGAMLLEPCEGTVAAAACG